MSNKNLLNESTIRKFMKLASIEPLASDFISKIQEAEEELEEGYGKDKKELDEAEEELEEGHGKKPHDEDLEEAKEEDVDEGHCGNRDDKKVEEDLDIDEMGGGMMYKDDDDVADLGAEADGGRMLDMDQFLDILEKAVEEFLGEPTDIERDEEPADDMEMDMGDEPVDDLGGEEDMELGVDLDAEEEEDEEEEEDLAESIYREVLKKLSKKK